jgi:uncharacterized protein YecT (DUF1311 family)
LIGAAAFTFADDSDKPESCDGSTIQMIECLEKQRVQWDKKLNDAYRELLSMRSPSRERRSATRNGRGLDTAMPTASIMPKAKAASRV